MTPPIAIHPEADAELVAAIRWYEARQGGLGAELLEAVDQTFSMVSRHRDLGGRAPGAEHSRIRRMLVQRFPYQVVYLLRHDETVVVAVAHLKKRPGYWRHRL